MRSVVTSPTKFPLHPLTCWGSSSVRTPLGLPLSSSAGGLRLFSLLVLSNARWCVSKCQCINELLSSSSVFTEISSEQYELVSWDDDIPNILENESYIPNHQPDNTFSKFFFAEVLLLFISVCFFLLDLVLLRSPRLICWDDICMSVFIFNPMHNAYLAYKHAVNFWAVFF